MTVHVAAARPARVDRPRNTRARHPQLHPSDAILATAVTLWAIGVSQIETGNLRGFGLVPVLPLIYFVALGLIVVSSALLLAAQVPSPRRLGLHVAALVVALYGTVPLLYSQPRYSWLYKHVGVVQYIRANGRLQHGVDIFHDWPGFFSLAAWFDRVAGISDPIVVAAWMQLVTNLLLCLVLYFALSAVDMTWRERWLAVLLFAAANWVAQDYFSPQAVGFVLSLGIFGIVLHWAADDRPGPRLQAMASSLRARLGTAERVREIPTTRLERRRAATVPAGPIVAVLVAYSALVVTHQLSPYVVALQLGALTIAGRIRPRWLAPVLLGLALAYIAPRFGYLDHNYGLLESLGEFFSNLRPPSALGLRLSSDQLVIARAARALSAFVWILAIVGAYHRFRVGRPVFALLVLAYSPFLLLALNAYGGEALLRVQLFSLPWSACLAASALFPSDTRRPGVRSIVSGVALLVALTLFLPSYVGSDNVYAMSPSSVRASRYLYSHGGSGEVIFLNGNFPVNSSAGYDRFHSTFLLSGDSRPGLVLSASELRGITFIAEGFARAGDNVYFVLSRSMLRFGRAYGLISSTSTSLRPLERAFERSPEWSEFHRDADTKIYEFAGG